MYGIRRGGGERNKKGKVKNKGKGGGKVEVGGEGTENLLTY